MKILFATQNLNKIEEVQSILPQDFSVLGLTDFNFEEDIPETQNTIEGNAIQKANFVFDKLGVLCFSEDTGLIVPSLNGEPGVFSARYAGPQRNASDNMTKLLNKLGNDKPRKAYFETVIALRTKDSLKTFTGRCHGQIAFEQSGNGGFGYDPIFIPDGYLASFAALSKTIKNEISHRGQAMKKLISYLS